MGELEDYIGGLLPQLHKSPPGRRDDLRAPVRPGCRSSGSAPVSFNADETRAVDAIGSRFMDGLMAIPAILLAIAVVAMLGASVGTLIFAIMIPEVPWVVRLVRSVVLSLREAPYVEAAQMGGTRLQVIVTRPVLPATVAPLIVQATYVCAAAIIIESALSFLGAGVSSGTATWGGMIAESRSYLPRAPWTVFAPGVALALVVLAVTLPGDGLSDLLDPRAARRG